MALDKKTYEAAMRFIDSCPDKVGLDEGSHIFIRWSKPGMGFGAFFLREKDGKVQIETEEMSKEFVKERICKMIDEAEVIG